MNNENIEVKKAKKTGIFTNYIYKAIPLAFDESMSYYETLCALLYYLKNTIIPTVNNNADAVIELQNKFDELQSFVDNYFDNLDVQEEINNKLDEMAESGELAELIHKLDDFSNSNKINTGNNLLTNDSLWLTHDGWTGNATNGFVHTVGETGDLEYNYNFDGDKTYLLEFTVTTSIPSGQDNNSNDFTVVIGNTQPIITYRGGGSMNYKIALKPTNQGPLKFKCVSHSDPYTPSDQFVGNIHNITLKELSGDLTQLAIKDNNGDASLPFSIMLNSNNSVAIGIEAGIKNYNQTNNVYIGYRSGKNDSTGYFNTGIGSETLQNVINASRNTAIGKSALANIISGDRNTAIGTFAMSGNKFGRKNIAIGFDTMMNLQNGQNNMAIGNQSLISLTNGSNQMAIGENAMGGSTYNGTNPNVAIGKVALYYLTTGYNNVAVGTNASYKNTTGNNNTAIGMYALSQNQTSSNNVAIGYYAIGGGTPTGGNNVAVGTNASYKNTTGNNNTAIGMYALSQNQTSSNNVAIGYYAIGGGTPTGGNNVAVGSTNLYYLTTGSGNTAIGNASLYKITTASNNIGIGANALNSNQTSKGQIAIGSNAGNKITDGGYSVMIGSDMNQANLTTASRSVAIGSVNLQNMASLTNSIIMGYNINADVNHTTLQNVIAINTGRRALSITRDNYINIANTIYADTFTVGKEKVGIGVASPYAYLHLPASTSDGGTAPLKFTAGTLMNSPENGAFEFDGTHLYFTIGNTRNTII